MSIEFFTDPDGRRCLLVDSVTEQAVPIQAFDSVEDAESFVEWVRAVHGKDPRTFSPASLLYLRCSWAQQPMCTDCRRVLVEGRCSECEDDASACGQ